MGASTVTLDVCVCPALLGRHVGDVSDGDARRSGNARAHAPKTAGDTRAVSSAGTQNTRVARNSATAGVIPGNRDMKKCTGFCRYSVNDEQTPSVVSVQGL